MPDRHRLGLSWRGCRAGPPAARPALAFVEGLDGSGKSTAAQACAVALSTAHRRAKIAVTDSTGVYLFCGGQLVGRRARRLYLLKPRLDDSRLTTVSKTCAYGLARRLINGPRLVGGPDVLISVRDPYRIDPAAYAKVYGWRVLSGLSPRERLRALDAVTLSPYADHIVLLQASVDQVTDNIRGRDVRLSRHETPECLAMVSSELPAIVSAYNRMYGSVLHEVEALTDVTSESMAARLEPLLGH